MRARSYSCTSFLAGELSPLLSFKIFFVASYANDFSFQKLHSPLATIAKRLWRWFPPFAASSFSRFLYKSTGVVVLFVFLTIRNVRGAVFASAASNLHFVFQ